jgi:hypothetical protein
MKTLYDTQTQALLPWPRIDDEPVVGLAPHLLEMTVVEEPRPAYDPATQRLEKTETIDQAARTVTIGWNIVEIEPPAVTAAEWVEQHLTSTQLHALSDLRLSLVLAGKPLGPLMQSLRDWTSQLIVASAADPSPRNDWPPAPCTYAQASNEALADLNPLAP